MTTGWDDIKDKESKFNNYKKNDEENKENKKSSSFIGQDSVLIYEYENFLLKKGLENDKHRGYSHFHPSAFGSCFRKMAFQYYNIPKDYFTEAKGYRIFDAGHAHHYRMQTHFAQMGILRGYWKCRICNRVHGTDDKIGIFCPDDCDCKKKINLDNLEYGSLDRKGLDLFEYEEILLENKEFNFKGHCDGIIELEKDNDRERYVIDFKTVKSEKFAFLKEPDPVYVVQINIYMWLSGIKKGIIFYEEKNSHELREFKVTYDESRIEDIKTNALKLKKVLEARQLPSIPKSFSKEKKPCCYCEFREKCWKKASK